MRSDEPRTGGCEAIGQVFAVARPALGLELKEAFVAELAELRRKADAATDWELDSEELDRVHETLLEQGDSSEHLPAHKRVRNTCRALHERTEEAEARADDREARLAAFNISPEYAAAYTAAQLGWIDQLDELEAIRTLAWRYCIEARKWRVRSGNQRRAVRDIARKQKTEEEVLTRVFRNHGRSFEVLCQAAGLKERIYTRAFEEAKARADRLNALESLFSTTGDDQPIPECTAIQAAHPTRTGRHGLYAEAMRLVGAKRSKGALVELVNWWLGRLEEAEAQVFDVEERLRELEEHFDGVPHVAALITPAVRLDQLAGNLTARRNEAEARAEAAEARADALQARLNALAATRESMIRTGFNVARERAEASEHNGWHRCDPFVDWCIADRELEKVIAAISSPTEQK